MRMLEETGRGHGILRSWSYRQLRVQRRKLSSFGGAASALDPRALLPISDMSD